MTTPAFAGTEEWLIQHGQRQRDIFSGKLVGENTVIGCVVTNAALNKAQAAKLAAVAQNGIARAVRPANATFDGDSLFAMCHGTVPADPDAVGISGRPALWRRPSAGGFARQKPSTAAPPGGTCPLYPNLPEPRKEKLCRKYLNCPISVSPWRSSPRRSRDYHPGEGGILCPSGYGGRDQCNQLVIRWQTAEALSYMRYSINTADPFYLAEKDYYDEVGPQAQNYLLEYTKAMLATPFRQELEESGAIIPLVFRSFEWS